MSDNKDDLTPDPQALRHVSQKELMREKRKEFYQLMKERTAPARKAAYERQKAAVKARRVEIKAKDKEAKAEARREAVRQRDEALVAALMPAERVRPKLKLVDPLD